MMCDTCDTTVVLTRRENRTLAAECECSDRSIKVPTVLPEGWSA
jgi:hypothetical protein